MVSKQYLPLRLGESGKAPRGLRSGRASNDGNIVTREIHLLAHGTQLAEDVHSSTSLKAEFVSINRWKSERPIVAMKSGNADGAKRSRFRIVKQGNRNRTPGRSNS